MSEAKTKELNIVIIDDSDFSRKTIAEILENAGYSVAGLAANAEEGMQLAASTSANVFFIDVVMPEIGGLEVAKFISEGTIGSYIVMMSSLNVEHVIIESISNGASDFLLKPFEPSDLLKTIKKIELHFAST